MWRSIKYVCVDADVPHEKWVAINHALAIAASLVKLIV